MILIALGANLSTDRHGPPEQGLDAAVDALAAVDIQTVARSRWYRSAPIPPAIEPWFVNGVIKVETAHEPRALMASLLAVEAAFGRERGDPGAARTLDLDLIDYHGRVTQQTGRHSGPALILPHPRLAERAFVLLPLSEVAPNWRHPATGASIATMLDALPPGQALEPF
jgi:2-amino-4-hydroxy-6-hydroxymethyldihydropteridine diphosphokinase